MMKIWSITPLSLTASIKITQSLRSLIVTQTLQTPLPDVSCIKAQIHQDRHSVQKERASTIRSNLLLPSQRALDLNSEPGASSWLAALPLEEQEFHLMNRNFGMPCISNMAGSS